MLLLSKISNAEGKLKARKSEKIKYYVAKDDTKTKI